VVVIAGPVLLAACLPLFKNYAEIKFIPKTLRITLVIGNLAFIAGWIMCASIGAGSLYPLALSIFLIDVVTISLVFLLFLFAYYLMEIQYMHSGEGVPYFHGVALALMVVFPFFTSVATNTATAALNKTWPRGIFFASLAVAFPVGMFLTIVATRKLFLVLSDRERQRLRNWVRTLRFASFFCAIAALMQAYDAYADLTDRSESFGSTIAATRSTSEYISDAFVCALQLLCMGLAFWYTRIGLQKVRDSALTHLTSRTNGADTAGTFEEWHDIFAVGVANETGPTNPQSYYDRLSSGVDNEGGSTLLPSKSKLSTQKKTSSKSTIMIVKKSSIAAINDEL